MNGAQYDNPQGTQQDAGMSPGATPHSPPPPHPYAQSGRRVEKPRKSPALATILSFMPGLGQVYVGYYKQGFINIMVIASVIALLNSSDFRGMEPFFGPFLAFFWIFNMIDANRRAHHFNRVAEGLGGEDVPEDFKLPGVGGSMFGGVVLIVVGVLFILDLNFGVSLAWIKDWWPLLLIVFGVRLVYQARRQAG
ncbi:hypothetical protein KDM41_11715 [bacterium]|nr:hypothetical protein [bacterium]